MQSNITIRPTRYGATWSVWRFALLFGILGLAPLPLHAGPPELSLPLDCKIGETCWLVNLVDRQPGPGRTDFRGGDLSYDTHKGTDFAIANDAEMQKGVADLAAAPGRVLRVRDGMPASTLQDLQSGTALRDTNCTRCVGTQLRATTLWRGPTRVPAHRPMVLQKRAALQLRRGLQLMQCRRVAGRAGQEVLRRLERGLHPKPGLRPARFTLILAAAVGCWWRS